MSRIPIFFRKREWLAVTTTTTTSTTWPNGLELPPPPPPTQVIISGLPNITKNPIASTRTSHTFVLGFIIQFAHYYGEDTPL